MENQHRPTLGLALSGSGNRTTFYVGFLEVLQEADIKIDYISACSGGSLVAAAYTCGTLPELKKEFFSLTKDNLRKYFTKGTNGGGLYSIDLVEEKIREFTKGQNFEDVRPLMGFVTTDIENGNKVLLSMGDIARAARISCTLPGVCEPVRWGGKTLVDGGILCMFPGYVLKQAEMDVCIGINMRGTEHIFTDRQMTAKKILNYLRKILLINEIENLVGNLFLKLDDEDVIKNPNLFSVLGKSLDLAILANKNSLGTEEECDLMIVPAIPRLKQSEFSPEKLQYFYTAGRECAEENLPKIKELIQTRAQNKHQ